MTVQKEPNRPTRSLNFLRREDGSWNLLVIFGGALGAAFVAFMLLDNPAPAAVKVADPAQAPGPASTSALSTPAAK